MVLQVVAMIHDAVKNTILEQRKRTKISEEQFASMFAEYSLDGELVRGVCTAYVDGSNDDELEVGLDEMPLQAKILLENMETAMTSRVDKIMEAEAKHAKTLMMRNNSAALLEVCKCLMASIEGYPGEGALRVKRKKEIDTESVSLGGVTGVVMFKTADEAFVEVLGQVLLTKQALSNNIIYLSSHASTRMTHNTTHVHTNTRTNTRTHENSLCAQLMPEKSDVSKELLKVKAALRHAVYVVLSHIVMSGEGDCPVKLRPDQQAFLVTCTLGVLKRYIGDSVQGDGPEQKALWAQMCPVTNDLIDEDAKVVAEAADMKRKISEAAQRKIAAAKEKAELAKKEAEDKVAKDKLAADKAAEAKKLAEANKKHGTWFGLKDLMLPSLTPDQVEDLAGRVKMVTEDNTTYLKSQVNPYAHTEVYSFLSFISLLLTDRTPITPQPTEVNVSLYDPQDFRDVKQAQGGPVNMFLSDAPYNMKRMCPFDLYTAGQKNDLMEQVRRHMAIDGHFLARVNPSVASGEFHQWTVAAKTNAKMLVYDCPRVVLRDTSILRSIKYNGSESRRGMYQTYFHAFVSAKTWSNVKPLDWTDYAGQIGMAVYGTGYTRYGVSLQDKDGKRYREEVEIREALVFLSWFCKPSGFCVDLFAGGCTTALACLRLGIFCVCVDTDAEVMKAAWIRVQQYYLFLLGMGMLPVIGADPMAPRRWEVKGKHWVRKAGELYKMVRKNVQYGNMKETARNKMKIDHLKQLAVSNELVVQSGKEGYLPIDCISKNYRRKDENYAFGDSTTVESDEFLMNKEMSLEAYLDRERRRNGMVVIIQTTKHGDIRGAGLVKQVLEGEVIGFFKGDFIPQPDPRSDKVIHLTKATTAFKQTIFFRGLDEGWCMMSQVNDGEQNNLGEINCEIVEGDVSEWPKRALMLVATKEIIWKQGDPPVPLLMSYGVDYWKKPQNRCWFPGCDRQDGVEMVVCGNSKCDRLAHASCILWEEKAEVSLFDQCLSCCPSPSKELVKLRKQYKKERKKAVKKDNMFGNKPGRMKKKPVTKPKKKSKAKTKEVRKLRAKRKRKAPPTSKKMSKAKKQKADKTISDSDSGSGTESDTRAETDLDDEDFECGSASSSDEDEGDDNQKRRKSDEGEGGVNLTQTRFESPDATTMTKAGDLAYRLPGTDKDHEGEKEEDDIAAERRKQEKRRRKEEDKADLAEEQEENEGEEVD